LVERGVRFVQLYHTNWDSHGGPGETLEDDLARVCRETDRGCAALVRDLKSRGLLDDVLVVWGGEFGRTPHSQGTDGRDHNNKGFTLWMAGGGVKGGMNYGLTDDYGYEAVHNKMHIHDWHATLLHLMGLDHERLTYRYAGRDFRLTDVHGIVAKEILA
jgi:hypothetical protein